MHVSTTALYWVEALTSLLVGTPIPDTSACSSLPAIGVEDELRQLHTQLDSLGPRKRNALIWFIVKVSATVALDCWLVCQLLISLCIEYRLFLMLVYLGEWSLFFWANDLVTPIYRMGGLDLLLYALL